MARGRFMDQFTDRLRDSGGRLRRDTGRALNFAKDNLPYDYDRNASHHRAADWIELAGKLASVASLITPAGRVASFAGRLATYSPFGSFALRYLGDRGGSTMNWGPVIPNSYFRPALPAPRLSLMPNTSSVTDRWKMKSAIEMEIRRNSGTFYDAFTRARSRLGYPGNFDYSTFRSIVQSTGLVSSYNSVHPNDKIAVARGYRGEIGGVATKVATLEGLKNSPDHVLFDHAIFCMETTDGKLPFSNAELKQIVRELTNGIYIHNTYPFFSLHFNDNGCLYPVIHPAYQNTLVGKVIGLLDYYMKCYLNGGFFDEAFLNTWHVNQNSDREFLKAHRRDLKKYCREAKLDYTSLREYTCKAGLEEKSEEKDQFTVRNNKFRTSFRIIAEQRDIKKHNNVFILDPDFNVEYTVDLAPDYKEYLEKYRKEHGDYPKDYQLLLLLYTKMAVDIKENMPKIPFCRDYFQMLGVISFLCYYLTTLKEMDQVPVLPPSDLAQEFRFPKALPPIPVRHYHFHPIKFTAKDIFKKVVEKNELDLNQWLSDVFENPGLELTQELGIVFATAFKAIIAAQIPPQADQVSDDYIDRRERKLVEEFGVAIKEALAEIHTDFNNNINDIINQAKATFEFDCKLDERKKTIDKIDVARWAIEKQYTRFITEHSEKFQIKMAATMQKQDSDAEKVISEVFQKIDAKGEEAIRQSTKQIENIKKTEIDKVPAAHRGRPEVFAFIRKLDEMKESEIKEIRSRVEKLKTEERIEIYHRLENIKTQIRLEIESNKKEFLDKAEQIKNHFIKRLTEIGEQITNLATQVFIAEKYTLNLSSKHPCSMLDIADTGFYQENGDNIRIVGGCGVKLPNLKPSVIPVDSPLRSALLPTLHQIKDDNFSEVTHQGKEYAVFKLKSQHRPAYSAFDYPELAETLNLPDSKTQSPFGSDEIQFLSQAMDLETKEIKGKFNSRAKDSAGQTLVHYAVSSTVHSTVLDSITADDKTILLEADKFGNLPIHAAATTGNTDAIIYILRKAPPCINATNQQGLTPLLLAAQAGHKSVVEKLVALGADVNYRLPNGLFALYLALQNNHTDVADSLIPKANINFHLDSGSTPLHLATDSEMDAISLALIRAGADINHKRRADDYTPFHNAVEKGSVEVCTVMLATGKVAINTPLPSGEYPLHLASKQGHLEIVRILVEAKTPADVNLQDANGDTPLLTAIRAGHLAVAIYLAERTKVNIKNKQGQTASLFALMSYQVDVADILFQRGEDPCIQDQNELNAVYYLLKNGEYHRYKQLRQQYKINPNLVFLGQSSLAIVAKQGHHLLVDYLLESKAEFQNNSDWELIHYAVKTNHIRFLRTWLKSATGSSDYPIKSGSEKNKTLIYIAAENNSEQCLQELLKQANAEFLKNAFNDRHLLYAAIISGNEKIIETILTHCEDVNFAIDSEHNTAIHIVVHLGLLHLVEFLVRCGADLNKPNNNQLTPFHFAIQKDDKEMLEKLFELTSKDNIPSGLYEFAFEGGKSACLKLLDSSSDANKNRALINACRKGHLNDVQTLLNDGIKPQEDKHGGHPLLQAVQQNNLAIVELLLPFSNDSELLIKCFKSALEREQIETIRILIERNLITVSQINSYYSFNSFMTLALIRNFEHFDRTKNWLLEALEQSDHVTFARLIQEEFPINSVLFDYKGKKQPLLHCAFKLKASWALSILVKQGADPRVKDYDGCTIMHKLNMFNSRELDQELHLIDLHFKQHKKELLESTALKEISPIDLALQCKRISHFQTLIKEEAVVYNKNGNTLLHAAVLHEDYALAESLIGDGVNVNAINHQLKTPLMLAVIKGNIKLVQLLLAQGADPNIVDNKQNSSLHFAIMGSYPEIAKLFIHSMISLDKPNRSGNTPLLLAASTGQEAIVDVLVSRQADIHVLNHEGQNAVHLAAQMGHAKIIEKLGALGVAMDLLETCKKGVSYTPLQWAAHQGHLNVFTTLIKLGADPIKKDSSGHTAVVHAIASKKIELIEHVMQLPVMDNPEYLTAAFFTAVEIEYMPLLTQLMLTGFNIDALKNDGTNALHLAARAGASKSTALLIEQGITLALANDGESPLHEAARSGSVSIIQQLCDAKCDVDIQSIQGMTALHLACEQKHMAAVLQLLKSGANPKLRNKEGFTAAQIALLNNDWQMARFLMVMGDDFYQSNFSNELPEHFRKRFERFEPQLKQMTEIAILSSCQFVRAIQAQDNNALLLLCQMYSNYLGTVSLISHAVKTNNLDAVKILIEYQPDCITHVDISNYNALTIALKSGHTEIADYLVITGATISQEIDGKNQIQLAIEANDGEAFLALLKFGAKLSLADMQFVLNSKELSESYTKFISLHNTKIENSCLSSSTIKNFIIQVKDALSNINSEEDLLILQYAKQLTQQAIDLNAEHLAKPMRYSKKNALNANIQALREIGDMLSTIKEEKCEETLSKPKKYEILYILKKWQETIAKPARFETRFDIDNHLSFFNIKKSSLEVVVQPSERCVIL